MRQFLKHLFLIGFFAFISASAMAQQDAMKPVLQQNAAETTTDAAKESNSASWAGYLDSVTQALSREGLTEAELNEFFEDAGDIVLEAGAAVDELQPQADQLAQQLEELGPAPESGAPSESADISQRRETLNTKFAEVDGKLKEAKLALVRAEQVQKTVTEVRRNRFVNSITTRSLEAYKPEFWSGFVSGFRGFYRGLGLLFADSNAVLWEILSNQGWKQFVLAFLLVLIALLYVYLRRVLLSVPASLAVPENDRETGNPLRGFFSFCAIGLLTGLLPAAIYFAFSALGLLTARLDTFLSEFAITLGFLIVAFSLCRILLRPRNPEARIVDQPNDIASNLFRILIGGLVIATILRILNITAVILVSPFEVIYGLSFLFSVVVALTYLWAVVVSSRKSQQTIESRLQSTPSRTWRYVKLLVWIVSIAILVALVAGYVALAEFLSLQLIFGTVVIASLWLVLSVLELLYLMTVERRNSDAGENNQEARTTVFTQIGVLGFGLLKMVAFLISGMLLLLPWGYRTRDFFDVINQAFFGFSIGGLNISLSTILTAFLLFLVGYVITVAIRNWLSNRLLPTTKLDIGLSNSITTMFGYAGFILAAILAISAAGFDLSNLAIVAGALSLGVGFGLQSIVSNFVSGLILLTERPIKSGDWVVTTGGEGTVKRISVRSTEIETFDRAMIIVPNSTLITDPVTNWTHTNTLGRIIIPIGVGYNSDPDEVREILLSCADEHTGILRKPAPVVYFMDFGADALQFQLRAFLADINYCLEVQSELRFACLRKFRKAGIEIPYPQRDLHIRSGLENFAIDPDGKTTKG